DPESDMADGDRTDRSSPDSSLHYYNKLHAAWVQHHATTTQKSVQENETGRSAGSGSDQSAASGQGGGRGFSLNLSGLTKKTSFATPKPQSPPRSLLLSAHYLSALDANRHETEALVDSLARSPGGPAARAQMARLALLTKAAGRLSKQLHRKAFSRQIPTSVGAMILTQTQIMNEHIKKTMTAGAAHLPPSESKVKEFLERLARQVQATIDRIMRALAPFLGKAGRNEKQTQAGPGHFLTPTGP
ncbi:MAG: hypothetical protein ACYDCF_10840, partial [Burkholderiales bacterium]